VLSDAVYFLNPEGESSDLYSSLPASFTYNFSPLLAPILYPLIDAAGVFSGFNALSLPI